MDKASLRAEYLRRRKHLSAEGADVKSAAIASRLSALIAWEYVERLHVYRSRQQWREVSTDWLPQYVAASWPHVELTVGDVSRTAVMPIGAYDVIVVPFVAFDDNGSRLGHGGGWYDRFLASQPQAHKIGLGYDLQRASLLPIEPHDQKLDEIVTESGVITISAFRRSLQ